MRRDFLADGLGQQVPQVPAVADLHRAGQGPADGLAVGSRPVTADDLDSGVVPQPLLRDAGGAALDRIDSAAGLGVGEVVAFLALAIRARIPVGLLMEVIYPYPTFTRGVRGALRRLG